MTRDLNVVVYGAAGYVGGLTAEALAWTAGADVRWGVAGRNAEALQQRLAALSLDGQVPVLQADASDPASLRRMAGQADVVISTVGPYGKLGAPLVAACVEAGTGYVDLCGEPLWMREMIDMHETHARETGARIVFSCGYDSLPFECGVIRLQQMCRARWGRPAGWIGGRVAATRGGGLSSGTRASLQHSQDLAAGDPAKRHLLDSPFALTPGFEGPAQPDMEQAHEDELTGLRVTPHIMAMINTKNVHRANLLSGHRFGRAFRYDEMIMASGQGIDTRPPAERRPGPPRHDLGASSQHVRPENGFFRLLFAARDPEHGPLAVAVTGDSDPGYGATSRMLAEAALCLALDGERPGGIWTPGALMGDALIARLEAKAGLAFREALPDPSAA